MNSLIRIVAALFFFCLTSLNVFSGTGSCRPVHQFTLSFRGIPLPEDRPADSVSAANSDQSASASAKESTGSAGRICSCQVLNLESSNYSHRYMVLLAEKSNGGSGSAYAVARNRIQKEKKLLKKMFYDKVSVLAELQEAGSCKSLYFRLHSANSQPQLYEILNADIR